MAGNHTGKNSNTSHQQNLRITATQTTIENIDEVNKVYLDGGIPTNDAFAKLPAGTVETLLKAENKAALAGVLTYHVVAGSFDAKAVVAAIQKGKGKLVLTTVAGGKLIAGIEDGKVVLTDEKGGKATVTTTDLKASNGIIHVIDGVVLPK